MKPTKLRRTPSFRLHKAIGQGFVELDGRRIYLGRYDRPETRQHYDRVLGEWLANGRRLPVPVTDVRIVEPIAAFYVFAEEYYRHPDGRPTSSLGEYKLVLRLLQKMYGPVRVPEFGPLQLKAV